MSTLEFTRLKSKLSVLADADQLVVGLDVHKKSFSAAFAVNATVVKTCVMPADPPAVAALLQPLKPALKLVVYESGPTGFGLARALQEAGIAVKVLAASQLPRAAKRGSKSDRVDCRSLAELAASGLPLPAVAIPDEEQEADRQLIRQRERIKHKRRKVMQQIKSFLLQHGIAEPDRCWGRTGIHYLHEVKLLPRLRCCLDGLLQELEFYSAMLKGLDDELLALGRSPAYQRLVDLCRSHPGVGVTLSIYLVTELFLIEHIRDHRQLVSYCGLAPMVRQSGERSASGPLIKSGKASVRALLVQCAWAWVTRDETGKRLYNRYLVNTGCAQKAIVAVARRMLINLWSMLRHERLYDPGVAARVA